jgi:hypothetical protein
MDESRKEFEAWYEAEHWLTIDYLVVDEVIPDPKVREKVLCQLKETAWEAWQQARKPKVEKPSVTWNLELMYKRRGERLPRFTSVGISTHQSHKEAVADGKRRAEVWLDDNFKAGEIESWDVKAQPVKA